MAMENEEYKGFTIRVEPDDVPESPRDWDNLGTMVCNYGGYTLGDEQFNSDNYDGWDDLEKRLIEDKGAVVILPLVLLDHSGLRMDVGSGNTVHGYTCQWDIGRVGFIYCTQEDMDKEGVSKERVKKILRSEVKTYDQYLMGDVYFYSVEDDEGEHVDSCGGIYGYDETIEVAKEAIDYEVEHREKQKKQQLRAYIQNNVQLEKRWN